MKYVYYAFVFLVLNSCFESKVKFGNIQKNNNQELEKKNDKKLLDDVAPAVSDNLNTVNNNVIATKQNVSKVEQISKSAVVNVELNPKTIQNQDCENLKNGQSKYFYRKLVRNRYSNNAIIQGKKSCVESSQKQKRQCINGSLKNGLWLTNSLKYIYCAGQSTAPVTVIKPAVVNVKPVAPVTVVKPAAPVTVVKPVVNNVVPAVSENAIKFKKLYLSDGGQDNGFVKAGAFARAGEVKCGISLSDELWCWGDNTFSQLGIGSTQKYFSSPQKVKLNEKVISATTAWKHTCAVTISNKLYCWGSNIYYSLGLGNYKKCGTHAQDCGSTVPLLVEKSLHFNSIADKNYTIIPLPPVKKVYSDYGVTCILSIQDELYCVGIDSDFYAQGTARNNFLHEGYFEKIRVGNQKSFKFKKLFMSGLTGCGHGLDGKVYCWGNNSHFQAGICKEPYHNKSFNALDSCNSSTAQRAIGILNPLEVMDVPFRTSSDVSYSLNTAYAFFLNKDTGKAYYRGQDPLAQKGRGGITKYFSPRSVFRQFNQKYVDISASSPFFQCVLSETKKVFCSSFTTFGGGEREMSKISTLKPVSIHVQGEYGICILSENNNVYCSKDILNEAMKLVQ